MRREPRSILLATVAHGAVLLAIGVAPRRPRRELSLEPKTVEIDLDLATRPELVPPLAGPLAPEPERDDGPRRYAVPVSAKVSPRGTARESDPVEPAAPAEEPETTAREDPPEGLPPGFREAPVDLLGSASGTNALLVPPPSLGEGGDKGAERAVRSSLREHDRRLGLGASGPVVAAAEDTARVSLAAVESHAVLEVVADGEGRVVSVTVSDASEDRAGWDGVARGVLAALRAKRVRVSRGSRGVAMTIAIDSREALPSGAAPGVNVSLFDQKVSSGKNDRSSSVAILPLARLPITLPVPGRPGVTQTKTIVLPIPTPNISGTFDLVDIGAPAARVVHAHATSEREL